MTQEQKQLLLVDLCARLPYGTVCKDIYGNSGILFDLTPELNSATLKISELGSTWTTDIDKVKPYLRPRSSMTKEEKEELKDICTMGNSNPCSTYEFFGIEIFHISRYGTYFESDYTVINWLNAHHFDYHGLIEKGLALEAPEDMYKSK